MCQIDIPDRFPANWNWGRPRNSPFVIPGQARDDEGLEFSPKTTAALGYSWPGIVSNAVNPSGIATQSGLSRTKIASVGRKCTGSSSDPA